MVAGPRSFKLPYLAGQRHLPSLPGQARDVDYGVIWDACPIPSGGSCYVVEFQPGSRVSIIAYVDGRGGAYRVDRPIALAPDAHPDFAAVPDPSGHAGTVYVKDALDAMAPLRERGRYRGSFTGTMREVHDSETWNTTRSLTYRPFMASMFLRYCVIDGATGTRGALCHGQAVCERGIAGASPEDRASADGSVAANADPLAPPAPRLVVPVAPPTPVDLAPQPLERPVRIFEGFDYLPLPDAIDALRARVDAQTDPSGIERFARRVLGELDLPRLRALTASASIALAYLADSKSFYLNFDRAGMAPADIALVHSAGTALNRVLRVLDELGFGLGPADASPSEEACSIIDRRVLRGLTGIVEDVRARALAANGWASPGALACAPGGEWDVRTRFAAQCERLNMVVRFEYDFRCSVPECEISVRYLVPAAASMPRSWFDQTRGTWHEATDAERAALAQEYAARMALVVAAAAFSSSFKLERCTVEQVSLDDAVPGRRIAIQRSCFTEALAPLARDANGRSLICGDVADGLARATAVSAAEDAPDEGVAAPGRAFAASDPRQVLPIDDDRPFPPELGLLLRAGTAHELVPIPVDDDACASRLRRLHEQARIEPQQAVDGLLALKDELEAACAARELEATCPVQTRWCEDEVGRIVLPVVAEGDPATRFVLAPVALGTVVHELVAIYLRLAAHDEALAMARSLLDLGPSSSRAYCLLISCLAACERYDEMVEVCRHGLRAAYRREDIAYLYYRLAFACWQTGDTAAALACYRMVPLDTEMGERARREAAHLRAELGCGQEAPEEDVAFEDAAVPAGVRAELARAGIPEAPTLALANQLADAAVLLTEHGFFYLAERCVRQMWSINRDDVLGAVRRSLLPPWRED